MSYIQRNYSFIAQCVTYWLVATPIMALLPD